MNWTRPAPPPDCPVSIRIQSTALAAVHSHPPTTITSTLPRPPLASKSAEGGASTHVHGDTWLTLTVRPATVNDPERCGPLFAPTVNATWPGPAPDVRGRLTHAVSLPAVHVQPTPVWSVTELAPPAGGAAYAVGSTLNRHPDACVNVTVVPATVAVPERPGPSVAGTVTRTTPAPLPLAPLAIA